MHDELSETRSQTAMKREVLPPPKKLDPGDSGLGSFGGGGTCPAGGTNLNSIVNS